MSFIGNSKQYDPETTRWYCHRCQCRRPLEHNPEWVAAGRPHIVKGRWPFEWTTRCGVCHYEHWDLQYDCEHCGRPLDEDQKPLRISNYHANPRASYEYGIEGHDWDEKHRCKTCGRIFWIGNGDW